MIGDAVPCTSLSTGIHRRKCLFPLFSKCIGEDVFPTGKHRDVSGRQGEQILHVHRYWPSPGDRGFAALCICVPMHSTLRKTSPQNSCKSHPTVFVSGLYCYSGSLCVRSHVQSFTLPQLTAGRPARAEEQLRQLVLSSGGDGGAAASLPLCESVKMRICLAAFRLDQNDIGTATKLLREAQGIVLENVLNTESSPAPALAAKQREDMCTTSENLLREVVTLQQLTGDEEGALECLDAQFKFWKEQQNKKVRSSRLPLREPLAPPRISVLLLSLFRKRFLEIAGGLCRTGVVRRNSVHLLCIKYSPLDMPARTYLCISRRSICIRIGMYDPS